jgi:hypothetical protein
MSPSSWLKPARNPPNRRHSSAAACAGFYSVKYICTWHRDPRWILAGRKEWAALRSYPGAYVLSVENGERWYFQTVIILPIALDTFLDVVG